LPRARKKLPRERKSVPVEVKDIRSFLNSSIEKEASSSSSRRRGEIQKRDGHGRYKKRRGGREWSGRVKVAKIEWETKKGMPIRYNKKGGIAGKKRGRPLQPFYRSWKKERRNFPAGRGVRAWKRNKKGRRRYLSVIAALRTGRRTRRSNLERRGERTKGGCVG